MSKDKPLFGRYQLTKLLGSEGEFIKFYQAKQLGLDREVEIRILSLPGGQSSPFLQRFLLETKLLAQMDHPSIIPVLDEGTEGGKAYFTTTLREYVRMKTYLAENGGSLTATEVLGFAEILTDALQEMHNNKMLHRNISTTTVFYDRQGRAPYFGECTVMKDIRSSLATEGLPYLSALVPTPERLAGIKEDERTDIFLICTFFYELLTGRFPFPQNKGLLLHGLPEATPIRDLLGPEEINEELGRAIMKGLLHDPDLRHQSAEVLADSLRDIARIRKVRLLVEERSFVRAKVSRAPSVAREESRGHQLAPFYLLAALLIMMTLWSIFPQSNVKKRQPSKVVTKNIVVDEDQEILSLFKAVQDEKTTKADFAERMKVFRRWFMKNSQRGKPICRYVEITRLQNRMDKGHDQAACQQLDLWIKKARERTLAKGSSL